MQKKAWTKYGKEGNPNISMITIHVNGLTFHLKDKMETG